VSQPFELALPVGAADHMLGPSHAVVTVVEYGDFECPNCKQAAPAVKPLLTRFAGRLRFAYRHFPLEDVHPHALHAALAAEAAAEQGKFWEMHDLLFDNQAHLKPKHRTRTPSGWSSTWSASPPRWRSTCTSSASASTSRVAGEPRPRTPGLFLNGMIQDASPGLRGLVAAAEKILHGR
jgi:hypothetical protein